jgi:hypothetical protein
LNELADLNGWHRDHARKSVAAGCGGAAAAAGAADPDPEVRAGSDRGVAGVLGDVGWAGWETARAGLPQLVWSLRRHGELDIDDGLAQLLLGMSAATIDRRLAADRASLQLKGRCHTKPGSLLKSQIPMGPGRLGPGSARVR